MKFESNSLNFSCYFLHYFWCDIIILAAISFINLAATDAVMKSTSLYGLYSTISAPTIRPNDKKKRTLQLLTVYIMQHIQQD